MYISVAVISNTRALESTASCLSLYIPKGCTVWGRKKKKKKILSSSYLYSAVRVQPDETLRVSGGENYFNGVPIEVCSVLEERRIGIDEK